MSLATRKRSAGVVEEHFHRSEAASARSGGALGRENVGTSNRNAGEIPARRKSKVSSAMNINRGLVGPKLMAKAEGDGQLVNIPALPKDFKTGRSLVYRAHYWICVRDVRIERRKIRAQAF